jgi:hypothetical protein
MDGQCHRRVGGWIACAAVVAWAMAFCGPVFGAVPPAGPSTPSPPKSVDAPVDTPLKADYYTTTTQLSDPLRPLMHLPESAQVRVRAIVATIPDPTETHLGRSFDMGLSAALSAYQSRGYMLDGYAFPWKPASEDAKPPPPKDASAKPKDPRSWRKIPGVLLFRRDAWRKPGVSQVVTDYVLVFLVGEAPSYGVHLDAFDVAARCAAAYNHRVVVPVARLNVNESCNNEVLQPGVGLDVLGPSFSGSMQSLAIAIGKLRASDCKYWSLPTLLLSASATVPTNEAVEKLAATTAPAGCTASIGRFEYFSLAWPLDVQFAALRDYLCTFFSLSGGRRVVVLAEESTFGRGAEELFAAMDPSCKSVDKPDAKVTFDLRTFPPNIASIRAEHSLKRSTEARDIPGMPKTPSRLLELDMTTTREALDRPITYEPGLTSRSDELMLYRTFDSLRMRMKPDAVVILATDIRDRLFLLGEIRNALPNALPVLMELDYLTIHPDYRDASRGAVVVAAGDSSVCSPRDPVQGTAFVQCWGRSAAARRKQEDRGAQGRGVRSFSFATDFAANTFRAARMLLDWRDQYRAMDLPPKFALYDRALEGTQARTAPCLYVATLAGLVEISRHVESAVFLPCRNTLKPSESPRGTMAAADTRIVAQLPSYLALTLSSLYFLLVALWVNSDPGQGRVLLPAARYVVFDGRWLKRLWDRLRRSPKASAPASVAGDTPEKRRWLSPDRVHWLMQLVVWFSLVALFLSGLRLFQQLLRDVQATRDVFDPLFGVDELAHGRDVTALASIWLVYGCACVVGFARLKVADHRLGGYMRNFVPKRVRPDTNPPPTLAWVLPVLATLLILVVWFGAQGLPLTVDAGWPWWIAGLVLACGIAFLVNVGRMLRLIGSVTMFVSSATPTIRTYLDEDEWPSPQLIHQLPQTPFNLTVQRRDVKALCYETPEHWGQVTAFLYDERHKNMKTGKFDSVAFEKWQDQLVAELKVCVVAARTCSWCAMLAPISVLLAMSTYPPIFEPKLTMLSIMLLLSSFAFTVYAVLRLEQDPMLGPMFTRNGDNLTFGGSLRALWPKFVAMGLVLVPLVLPDVWRWLHDMVRSINSFS